MKIRMTFALAAATLTLGVPVAAANPDGYQPQLQPSVQPDAIDRYLANNGPDGFQPQMRANAQPDAVDRYLRNNPSGVTASVDRGGTGAGDSRTGAFLALGGVLFLIVAAVVASTMRARRRLVLH